MILTEQEQASYIQRDLEAFISQQAAKHATTVEGITAVVVALLEPEPEPEA